MDIHWREGLRSKSFGNTCWLETLCFLIINQTPASTTPYLNNANTSDESTTLAVPLNNKRPWFRYVFCRLPRFGNYFFFAACYFLCLLQQVSPSQLNTYRMNDKFQAAHAWLLNNSHEILLERVFFRLSPLEDYIFCCSHLFVLLCHLLSLSSCLPSYFFLVLKCELY